MRAAPDAPNFGQHDINTLIASAVGAHHVFVRELGELSKRKELLECLRISRLGRRVQALLELVIGFLHVGFLHH